MGCLSFFYPNEISQPPHEKMTKLEATLVEMKRVHAECATSQLTFEKEQPKEEESMSIEELVRKYMNEQENMATMSFEG